MFLEDTKIKRQKENDEHQKALKNDIDEKAAQQGRSEDFRNQGVQVWNRGVDPKVGQKQVKMASNH